MTPEIDAELPDSTERKRSRPHRTALTAVVHQHKPVFSDRNSAALLPLAPFGADCRSDQGEIRGHRDAADAGPAQGDAHAPRLGRARERPAPFVGRAVGPVAGGAAPCARRSHPRLDGPAPRRRRSPPRPGDLGAGPVPRPGRLHRHRPALHHRRRALPRQAAPERPRRAAQPPRPAAHGRGRRRASPSRSPAADRTPSSPAPPSPIGLVVAGRALTTAVVAWSRRAGLTAHRTVLVGGGALAAELAQKLAEQPALRPAGRRASSTTATTPWPRPACRSWARLDDLDRRRPHPRRRRPARRRRRLLRAHLLDVVRGTHAIRCDLLVVPRLHHFPTQTGRGDHIGSIPVMRIRTPNLQGPGRTDQAGLRRRRLRASRWSSGAGAGR